MVRIWNHAVNKMTCERRVVRPASVWSHENQLFCPKTCPCAARAHAQGQVGENNIKIANLLWFLCIVLEPEYLHKTMVESREVETEKIKLVH